MTVTAVLSWDCPQGVRNYSTPVGLDSKVLVDLVVVGSVAVSEKGKITHRNSGMPPLTCSLLSINLLFVFQVTVSEVSFLGVGVASETIASVVRFKQLTPSLPPLASLGTFTAFSPFLAGSIK